MKNPERLARIQVELRNRDWDLIICGLPKNVLLLSGYWPVIGTSVAISFADGPVALLVPEDEEELAQGGWADEVRTFKPATLDQITTPEKAIREPLRELIGRSARPTLRIGFETGGAFEPASYAAMHSYAGTMQELLCETFPGATLIPAGQVLADLRERQTEFEIQQLRVACEIAATAFSQGSAQIRMGESELETAAHFRLPLSTSLAALGQRNRADGFAWCMSGSNSALAAAAYARSRSKRIEPKDLLLIHINSYADGYWTDVTRTYVIGKPDDRQQRMFDAISAARQAALNAIRPGAKAADVDKAARDVLKTRGFGPQFKHSTGHGVGFSAIDADAQPRLHPKSNDTLQAGMVFNVEPAIYFAGYGGMRHCDMVAVTDSGAEVLTPFQSSLVDLAIDG